MTSAPFTIADLRRVGRACYGDDWVTAMARDLGNGVRTVQRWAAGSHRLPDDLPKDLAKVVRKHIADLPARRAAELLRETELMDIQKHLK